MKPSGGPCNSAGREPSLFIPIEILGIVGICLPAITIYLCIITSFYSHDELIAHLPIPSCPHSKISLPPVSYTIATWAPQKQLWMLSLCLHLPARSLLMQMIPQIWSVGKWRYSFYLATSIETLSLVGLSLFHNDTDFHYNIHFFFFGLWWMSTIAAMTIVVHSQRASGYIHRHTHFYRSWLLKIVFLISFILGSCTISTAFPLAKKNCSLAAYTVFTLGEYMLIALNSSFWAVVVLEFSGEFDGFRVVSVRASGRREPRTASSCN